MAKYFCRLLLASALLAFWGTGINNACAATSLAPSITTQPASQTVTSPATATFTVVATGTPTPTYQWQQEVPGASLYTAIIGATRASYTTPATTLANSGTKYACVVTNTAGSATSNAATLTVNVVPKITTQPVSQTVTSPATATFTVVATGTPTPTYQWTQAASGATVYTAISGATSASYTTPPTTLANSKTKYKCVVTNAIGRAISSTATLTVNVVPSIAAQPANQTVTSPSSAIFTVSATGTPTPTYRWQQEAPGASLYTAIIGATRASYRTPVTTLANSGTKYECVVTNAAGNVTSNAATLTVNVVPRITTQPASQTVTSPATATFTVVATGTPTPTYQWTQEASGAVVYTAISGATSASYTTPATTLANSGTKYKCEVTNAAGHAMSSAATLTVNVGPSITTQPANATVTSPAPATFTVVATGTPTPTYQWTEEASGAAVYTAITGATRASYTTPATTLANSGTKYECVVTNAAGSTTSNAATLTVNVVPSITTQPTNQTVASSATATFTVAATGTPTPTYQWAQEASGSSVYTAISGATSASYTTPPTTLANSGTKYKCVVTNAAGSVTSNPASLTVNISLTPVVSITSPANNSTLTAGSNMTITATASETNGTINSVSFYNGSTLLGTSTTSPYSYTLTTIAVGIYTLTAKATDANGVLTTSSPVKVTVRGQPVVTIASPANHGAFTTGSINITAIASENYGAISSVAFYNGATLLGKVTSTSTAFTYSWTNISAGTYNVTAVAMDSIGATVTSSPITMTINAAPFTYAVDDNLLTKTDARNHTTTYQYDNLNRRVKTTFADGTTVAYGYDLFGNQISVTDQRGHVLTKTYDAYERLAQTKDPNGGTTQFNYDTEGRLLTLTDANGHATTYTYDPNGKVLTQTNALNFTTAFAYDPVGNVITRTDANAKATAYTYDALNRLTNINYPDSTQVTNVYDALGRRTSMTDTRGQTTYTYDALNRLLSKTDPGTNSAIAYTYDSEGNRLTSVDQNNRTITNAYDALNRLASVTDPNGTTLYGYDAVANRISVRSPNGVTESYAYDVLNRVLTAVNAKGAGVIASFTNVYDVAGMITKKTFQDASWMAYSYDALNRLLEETRQTNTGIIYDYVYSYDAVGNRLSWVKNTTLGNFWSVDSLTMPLQVLANMTTAGFGNTANPTQTTTLARSYNYDAANRLTNWNYAVNIYAASFPVQTDTYTYDQNGNRLTKQAVLTGQAGTPQQTTYGYDFENRLNQLQYVNIPGITGTQTDTLTYSGDGLRTQAVRNSVAAGYLYDGLNVLVERDGSGNTTKSYTRGLGFPGGIGGLIAQNYANNNTAVTQYYHYDDLGSVSNTTTSTGTTASSYNYDAFGNLLTSPASGDTNRYLFSTKEFDVRSGLYDFGQRYYDPEIGRWLTQDPAGFINGPNMYSYCLNNPVNCVDLYGLSGTLTIYSMGNNDGTSGSGGMTGHSWISYTPDNTGKLTTYGTWGNNPKNEGNGLHPNFELPFITDAQASRSTWINDQQETTLMNTINQYQQEGPNAWQWWFPCSTFASDAWNKTTGESLNPYGPYSNPSTLVNSINNVNNTVNMAGKETALG